MSYHLGAGHSVLLTHFLVALDSFSNQCLKYSAPFGYPSLSIDFPVES